jgi:hypothetical protein
VAEALREAPERGPRHRAPRGAGRSAEAERYPDDRRMQRGDPGDAAGRLTRAGAVERAVGAGFSPPRAR